MLKEHDQFIRKLVIIADCIVIGAAFLLTYILGYRAPHLYYLNSQFMPKLPPIQEYAWMLIIVIPVWITCLSYFKMYKTVREKKFFNILLTVFEASLLSILIFSAIAFLFSLSILSRTFVITLFLCVLFALLIEKSCILVLLHYIRRRGYNYRTILIVGSGERAKNFAQMLEIHPHWGLKVIGFIDEVDKIGLRIGNKKVMGSFKDLTTILDEYAVSEVVFILPRKWLPELENYIKICEKVGVKATIAVDFFNTSIARPIITELNHVPLLTLDTTPVDEFQLFAKRVMDITISLTALIIFSPIFLIYSMALKITSPGPVFFKQQRCGLYGKVFTLYKFRTMIVNAEKMLDKIKDLNESDGPIFHSRNDPRVTSIGRILRKTSLDELPQLINVIKGDMSIIGPRPPLPEEVKEYERWQRRRMSLRPGIVCTWQVTERFQPDFKKWMQMDMDYIDNWSLGLDTKIIMKIFPAIVKGFMHWQEKSKKVA
ncbi:UDP-glucose:undecaprenyl-phosphate glucose-1-phosphate transferase [Candidatus Brocadiaceae bacterium B188]|jgi:exopolysaccharide biosynthesis polyprenyl glycosylphosphotransferase|nr:sugar transferase [Candidatus Brocadia sapporoensis]OQZ02658.1 MAG: hypothetical protein B6D34_09830 [Candidatus Brocadia sp. UTAMX1]QQR67750.1 MAG: sugar transferase [Candidatus Brocadia sp.]RZV56406.1 MAG: sugar transferase [Candidatus Brocadia sp. BROELEC01]TWU52581.1 UDP-glucose:undecaprenyl-phosphate glucose-1-phosphate transferase [Candidatus Brocadiaceae bacterium B188]